MLPPRNDTTDGSEMFFEDDEPLEGTIINAIAEAARNAVEEEGSTPVDKIEIADVLPVLPLKDTVIYPHIVAPLLVTEEPLIKLIDDALAGDRIVAVFTAKEGVTDELPGQEDLYDVGSAVAVARMFKLPDGKMQMLVQGITRIKAVEYTQTEPYLKAKVERLSDVLEDTVEVEALARNALNLFRQIVSLAPYLPEEIYIAAMNVSDPNDLADFLAANINLDTKQKQEILEELNVKERLRKLTIFLNHEVEVLEIGSKIQSQVQSELGKGQREFYLREQMKAIQKELGEMDEKSIEINELREAIDASGMPEEARKEAERELDRLENMPSAAAEYTVARTYLDWMISLPWQKSTEDNLDVKRAAKILDEDHYDLERVKERIVEYLAVRNIKKDTKGPILCFVGPPGVGKTSLGHSIARALGRNFHRISLGGVRDEAEIRGHRRTYVGALPGRIIQGLRKSGTNNPVFMLDEVDKMGVDFRGDPAAALLEVLDPEQNFSFSDHYLDVPFDLSHVMFITTANVMFTIPPALLDRMEVLELPGYTEPEKVKIAVQFLVPRQLEEHGLDSKRVKIEDDALRSIIRNYTREAGVRNLEREIAGVLRKIARKVAEGDKGPFKIKASDLHDMIGAIKFRQEVIEQEDEVGVATGLAWTEVGGDVLFVEAESFPGKGALTLTGKLGEVMQESARAAVTYARANSGKLGIADDFFDKNDVHIHVPAGAIPKDGPSAGVTMAVALVSAATEKPVEKDVAMTGEITLRGKVLPVGGIKEKVLAAHRAGVKKVILPEENEKDLEEVPDFVKQEMQFSFVKTVDEIMAQVLKGGIRKAQGKGATGAKKEATPAKAKARAKAK
jgi:ATP-dependent Lon protease